MFGIFCPLSKLIEQSFDINPLLHCIGLEWFHHKQNLSLNKPFNCFLCVHFNCFHTFHVKWLCSCSHQLDCDFSFTVYPFKNWEFSCSQHILYSTDSSAAVMLTLLLFLMFTIEMTQWYFKWHFSCFQHLHCNLSDISSSSFSYFVSFHYLHFNSFLCLHSDTSAPVST